MLFFEKIKENSQAKQTTQVLVIVLINARTRIIDVISFKKALLFLIVKY